MPKTLDELKLLDLAHHLERQPETASPGEVRRLAEYVRQRLERPAQVTVPDGSVLRGELRFTQDVLPHLGSPVDLAPEGAERLDLGGGVRMLDEPPPDATFRIDDTRAVPLTLRPAGWLSED